MGDNCIYTTYEKNFVFFFYGKSGGTICQRSILPAAFIPLSFDFGTTVKAVVEVPKEEINECLAALEALHKNRSQADEALIAAIEHIAAQLHRKIHSNDDNIIYSAEQRRGR
eukprot:g40632.t1